MTLPRTSTWPRRRVALAGILGGLALAGGAGAAYAASSASPVETGYAVVTDDTSPAAGAQSAADPNCPFSYDEGGAAGGSEPGYDNPRTDQ